MNKINFPDSSVLDTPHKIEGEMPIAKTCFYDLAKNKTKFLTDDQMKMWQEVYNGKLFSISPASYILSMVERDTLGGGFDKWILNLEIVVNKDAFKLMGKDYSELIPIVIEHEIYEAWLSAKKGVASTLDVGMKHRLARRREVRLAQELGLVEKLLEWYSARIPGAIPEIQEAIKQVEKSR